MTGGAHVRDELGGYVLGALEPDERAEGLEIPAAPAAVEERLLDRVAREHRGRRARRRPGRAVGAWLTRGRALALGTLAGAGLGAGVTAFALAGGDDPPPAPPARYSLALDGTGGASARAEFEPGREGTEVHLWVRGLPPGGDAVYEVHCERAGWSASAGTFRADARGRAYVVLTTAARLGEYERIRVVRRSDPAGGAVLTGEI